MTQGGRGGRVVEAATDGDTDRPRRRRARVRVLLVRVCARRARCACVQGCVRVRVRVRVRVSVVRCALRVPARVDGRGRKVAPEMFLGLRGPVQKDVGCVWGGWPSDGMWRHQRAGWASRS